MQKHGLKVDTGNCAVNSIALVRKQAWIDLDPNFVAGQAQNNILDNIGLVGEMLVGQDSRRREERVQLGRAQIPVKIQDCLHSLVPQDFEKDVIDFLHNFCVRCIVQFLLLCFGLVKLVAQPRRYLAEFQAEP